jgi:hypothetical protein
VSLGQLKVMSAIERCRTAALGGHVARCENDVCGHTVIAYNSCRNRHCPRCQGAASRKWLAERAAELLPASYFHVVYTLPAELRDVTYQNKRVIYGLLMKASAETTLQIAANPKHLGARIGITAVLHTWGSAMTHHPHVHMIVPGGGLSPDGMRWIASRKPSFFVHVNALRRLFRGKVLSLLTEAHAEGRLQFFGKLAALADKKTFKRFLAPLRRIKWVVYCKDPLAGPEAVLRYLSRYTHRVAISNRRLIAADDGGVSFRWKDYRVARPRALEDDDAPSTRVHQAVPAARAAERLPSHPPLRPLRQRQPHREYRQGARAAGRGTASTQARACRGSGRGRAAPAVDAVPLLRRPHARHRSVRARLRAEAPPDTATSDDQDRYVVKKLNRPVRSSVDRRRWSCTGSNPSCTTAPDRHAKCPSDALAMPLRCRADRPSIRDMVPPIVRRTRVSALDPGARPQSP